MNPKPREVMSPRRLDRLAAAGSIDFRPENKVVHSKRRPGGYCHKCFSVECEHLILEGPRPIRCLTPREYEIVQMMLDPKFAAQKDMAVELNVTVGSLKVYIYHLRKKLGLTFDGSNRGLTLWVVAHAEALGIPLPTPEQFAR